MGSVEKPDPLPWVQNLSISISQKSEKEEHMESSWENTARDCWLKMTIIKRRKGLVKMFFHVSRKFEIF